MPGPGWGPAASGAALDTFTGEFQGHCRSRSRDVSGVTRVGGSCCSVSRPEGSLLRAERRARGSGSCSSLGIRPYPVLCRRWYSIRPVPKAPPGGPIDSTAPTCKAEAPPYPRGSHEPPGTPYSLIAFARFVGCLSSASLYFQFPPPRPCWFRPHSLE